MESERESLIKKVDELRKEVRDHYDLVGKSLYLITLELDSYLNWLRQGLQEKEEVPKPQ